VNVGARDLANVAVPLRRTATLRGRIALSDGLTLPPDARIVVSLTPANGDPALGLLTHVTNLNQPLAITGLLGGAYLVSASPSLGTVTPATETRVASITWQGREIRDTGLDASATQELNDVVITLTNKTITVTGTVVGSNGPQSAAVIAFPVDPARWINFGLAPPIFDVTRSASSGAYRLGRLVEGDYYFIAVDSSDRDKWVNPQFLAAAAPKASRVSLKWGDKQAVNLTLAQVVIK
jgi:hypothetical protein